MDLRPVRLTTTRIFRSSALTLGLMAGMFGASAALAQGQCSCVTPLSSAPTGGVVTPISGSVTVTGLRGEVPIIDQAPLPVNGQFSTAVLSSASFVIGSCNGTVGAQVSVVTSQIEQNICVRQTDDSLLPPPDNGAGLGVAVAGAAVVAGGGVLLFSTGEEEVSK